MPTAKTQSPSKRNRVAHVDTAAIAVTRLVLIEGPDEGDRPELVYVAENRECAEAFAKGFNLAQMFSEGRAMIGSEAVGLTLVQQDETSDEELYSWLGSAYAKRVAERVS